MFPQKPVRMNTVYGPKNCTSSQQRLLPNNNVSTRDSLLKISNGSGSSSDSGSHAHSDGRLHYLCRHKSCSSNKTRPSIEGQMFCKQNNNASCQDIDKLRKLSYVNKNPLTTFNSIAVVADDIRLNSNCFWGSNAQTLKINNMWYIKKWLYCMSIMLSCEINILFLQ